MRAVRTITNSDYRSPTASLFSKLELLDIFQVNTRDITKFMLRLACSRLPDSRARGIEKARTRKKKRGGNWGEGEAAEPVIISLNDPFRYTSSWYTL